MDRKSIFIGFLAGGWAATLLLGTVFAPAKPAAAEDPPVLNPPLAPSNDPINPNSPGRTINPITGDTARRGIPNPGVGTTAANNRAIALSGSIGGGESAVYYFDTELQRLLVYQFKSGSRGGLQLLAARHIDMDLRLEGYRDVSERSRDELKADYEKYYGKGSIPAGPGDLPVKKVEIPGPK